MKELNAADLAQFTGSTTWFRHSFNRAVIYTEGIQYLMEKGEAYWLIDLIAGRLGTSQFQKAAAEDPRIGLLHFWKLAVRPDRYAFLKAVVDTGEPPFIEVDIAYTDFPLESVDVWAQNNGEGFTLMLPSEY